MNDADADREAGQLVHAIVSHLGLANDPQWWADGRWRCAVEMAKRSLDTARLQGRTDGLRFAIDQMGGVS